MHHDTANRHTDDHTARRVTPADARPRLTRDMPTALGRGVDVAAAIGAIAQSVLAAPPPPVLVPARFAAAVAHDADRQSRRAVGTRAYLGIAATDVHGRLLPDVPPSFTTLILSELLVPAAHSTWVTCPPPSPPGRAERWNADTRPHRHPSHPAPCEDTLCTLLGRRISARLVSDAEATSALVGLATPSAHDLLVLVDLHDAVQQHRNMLTAPHLIVRTHVPLITVMALNLRLVGALRPPDYTCLDVYDTLIRKAVLGAQQVMSPMQRRARTSIYTTVLRTHGLILQLMVGATSRSPTALRTAYMHTRWHCVYALAHLGTRRWMRKYADVMRACAPTLARPANYFDAAMPSGFIYIMCGVTTALTYVGCSMAAGLTRWLTHVGHIADSCASLALQQALGPMDTRQRPLPYLRADSASTTQREDAVYARMATKGGLPEFAMAVIEYMPHSEPDPRA